MIALIDADSLLYLATYKLDDAEFIESKGLSHLEGDDLHASLAEFGADRLEVMIQDILSDIASDENNIEISGVELYVTNCKNSIRKKVSAEYKSNRKPNPIVNHLRAMYIFKSDAICHDEYEADDLIADRAKELGEYNCIVVTMDKDLNQIGGFIYNYYRKPSLKDEEGNVIEEYPRKGLMYFGKFEAAKFLAKQMLVGDSGDVVKGLPKYGEKKAEKVLDGIKTIFGLKRAIISEYKNVYGEQYIEPLQLNFRLLYLGKY